MGNKHGCAGIFHGAEPNSKTGTQCEHQRHRAHQRRRVERRQWPCLLLFRIANGASIPQPRRGQMPGDTSKRGFASTNDDKLHAEPSPAAWRREAVYAHVPRRASRRFRTRYYAIRFSRSQSRSFASVCMRRLFKDLALARLDESAIGGKYILHSYFTYSALDLSRCTKIATSAPLASAAASRSTIFSCSTSVNFSLPVQMSMSV